MCVLRMIFWTEVRIKQIKLEYNTILFRGMYRLKAGGLIMFVLLIIISTEIASIIIITEFMKDKKHDLVIAVGKFRLSITVHEKE